MALTVHHYFPLGSENVGDPLVARAIRAAVRRHFGEVEFVDVPVNDRYPGNDRTLGLRGDNIDRANEQADLVIVGGSNLLEARKPRRHGLFGKKGNWGVYTDVESLNRLRVPMLLLGMGTGSSFGKSIRPYHPPALDEVRLMFKKAFASAVRDVTTVDKLREIGVHTECTGCPVTFLTDLPVAPADPGLPLMVSFPPPRIVERVGGRAYLRAAMDYVEWLHEHGRQVVVTLHDMGDVGPAKEWVPPGVEVFCTPNLDELIARFEQSCGVIGFRLHAALLGLGLGKPVIPVGVDWRGLAFIDTFEVRDLSTRAHRFGQSAKLRDLTLRLLANDPVLIGRLARAKAYYFDCYERFLADAATKFRAIAGTAEGMSSAR
ncbi:MAG TPA: polysaccharide pyruvyl transferase family protein [Tepidisphaeraceae bacterium]|nr:polysaccharide pyruvyl transferase family protein [Tepidisphaeraceae bacterium]